MDSPADQPFGAGREPPGGPQFGVQPLGGPPGGPQFGTQPPIIAEIGTRRRIRPGRVWYLAALAVALGGVAWLAFGLISINSQINAFPRAPLPAGGAVTLNHGGGYVVYYEGAGAASGLIPSFHVQIVPASASAAVDSHSLQPYTASVTYTFGSHQGRAVLTLQVTRPGRFLVEPSGAPAVAGGSDLAFGSSIAGGIVSAVLVSIALILIGTAGAVVLFIIRLTRTRRARAQGAW
jgi:hypothetical protein